METLIKFLAAEEASESRGVYKMRPRGLKPGPILKPLRGAEAPLFHVTGRTCPFFRRL